MSTEPHPTVDFDGRWYNQHKSYMELRVDKQGRVTGEYTTMVGAPGNEEVFPLVGHAADDQVSFAVNFGKYGSLTAWVGQQTEVDGDATIVTFWHLTKNISDPQEPKNQWASILTGSDVFARSVPKVPLLTRAMPSHPRVARRT